MPSTPAQPSCVRSHNMICRETTTTSTPIASASTPRKYDPRAYIMPEDPLDTFDGSTQPLTPLPTDFPAWRKTMEDTLTLCHTTETGLNAYMQVLLHDRHPDLTPRFKDQEQRRVAITRRTLRTAQLQVQSAIKDMQRFLQDLCSDRDTAQPAAVSDYVMGWSDEFRAYVAKARAYLVSAHVFYKVNYALCPVREAVVG